MTLDLDGMVARALAAERVYRSDPTADNEREVRDAKMAAVRGMDSGLRGRKGVEYATDASGPRGAEYLCSVWRIAEQFFEKPLSSKTVAELRALLRVDEQKSDVVVAVGSVDFLRRADIDALHVGPGVYFIADGDNRVKIGHSHDCVRRLKMLQVGNSSTLRLLHVIREPISSRRAELEADLHGRFRFAALRGEWFEGRGPLLDYIERVCREECWPT